MLTKSEILPKIPRHHKVAKSELFFALRPNVINPNYKGVLSDPSKSSLLQKQFRTCFNFPWIEELFESSRDNVNRSMISKDLIRMPLPQFYAFCDLTKKDRENISSGQKWSWNSRFLCLIMSCLHKSLPFSLLSKSFFCRLSPWLSLRLIPW